MASAPSNVFPSPDFSVSIAIIVGVITTIALLLLLRSRNARVPKCVVRGADEPATAQAGEACLRCDLVAKILQSCHPSTQLSLGIVSRGWRDAVAKELDRSFVDGNSFAIPEARFEAHALSIVCEKSFTSMLAAETLRLPGCLHSHLAAEEGKGVAVLITFSRKLSKLDMSMNLLGDVGASHIAAPLATNGTLKSLRLDANEVGDDGAKALAASLAHNTTLTLLNLNENGVGAEVHFRHEGESAGIGDEGAAALAASLEANSTLQTLLLASNEIGDRGARAIAASLQTNTTLTKLDLRCNHLSGECREELAALATRTGKTILASV